MSRLGIDSDMLAAAQDIAEALERANEGLVAVQDSLDTMQRFAKRLEDDADTLYAKAKTALLANEEEKAKKMLLDRHSTTQKLKDTLKSCVEMKQRLDIMERNVAVLETKAVEIESLLQRTVGAKAIQSAGSMNGLSLQDEDPLLQRFRDLGID
jgi:phage shock protein A